MPSPDTTNWSELILAPETSLVVQRGGEEYDNNYVRSYAGPVRVRLDDSEKTAKIGEIEVWYLDGSRAADNELDIADICDSLGQMEADYAAAIYTEGSIDPLVVEDRISNDVLVIHSLTVRAKYHGMEARIIRTIAETIGYHCGTVLMIPERVGIAEGDELDLVPTRDPVISCLSAYQSHSAAAARAGARRRQQSGKRPRSSSSSARLREASVEKQKGKPRGFDHSVVTMRIGISIALKASSARYASPRICGSHLVTRYAR